MRCPAAPAAAPAGGARRWIDHPASATFDLVLLHYGNASELRCPHCTAVIYAAGPKWQLVWQLTQHPSWPQLREGKRAVMVADDDLVMDTCTLNRCACQEGRQG